MQGARVIQAAACAHFRLEMSELLGSRRYGPLVDARHLAMYLCRQRLRMSYPALGEVFKRDHSTVLTACRVIGDRIDVEPELRRHLDSLGRAIDEVARREQWQT